MRKLIFATVSAIALGIAGTAPVYAQNANTGPAAPPAPQDQGTAAGTMPPGAPQAGVDRQQTPPAAGLNNPDMASSSQSGAVTGRLSRTDIQNIQQKLQQNGLYRGRIDGLEGPGTDQALRAYQQQNGLPVTGTPDQQTLASLNGTGAGVGSSTMPNSSDMNRSPSSGSGTTNPNPPTAPGNQQ
jgi:peptidoglycan hydrolase-like protein with peptidoglycan-binding domain